MWGRDRAPLFSVFELKNWDRITPSGAETIILQIKRQRAVMKEFYGEGMQHGGLLISERTKLSDKVVEMFKSEGISIKRAEYLNVKLKRLSMLVNEGFVNECTN